MDYYFVLIGKFKYNGYTHMYKNKSLSRNKRRGYKEVYGLIPVLFTIFVLSEPYKSMGVEWTV